MRPNGLLLVLWKHLNNLTYLFYFPADDWNQPIHRSMSWGGNNIYQSRKPFILKKANKEQGNQLNLKFCQASMKHPRISWKVFNSYNSPLFVCRKCASTFIQNIINVHVEKIEYLIAWWSDDKGLKDRFVNRKNFNLKFTSNCVFCARIQWI